MYYTEGIHMFALRFVLNNSIYGQPVRTRMVMRRTLNDESFFTWPFLLWFGKLASMLGISYIMFPLQFDIDFLKEFPLLLILLPIVVFFSTWPRLIQVIGHNSFKWAGVLFGFYLIMSFVFALKDFVDVEKINHNLLKNSVQYSYNLEVPKSQSHQKIERKSLVTDIYVVGDSTNGSKPLIFFNYINSRVELAEINKQLDLERDKLMEFERHLLTANLHIDKDLPMGYVNELKQEFRKADLQKIQFSTGRKYSKYPSNHPGFKHLGIRQSLYLKYYPEFETFLDSAENLDFSRYSIRLPESSMYRINALKGYNRIEIYVNNENATLNGEIVSKEKLEQIVYKFIKKYSPNYVIIFNVDNQVTYGRYIEYLDLIHSRIDQLRNEMSVDLYKQPLNSWYWGEELDSIKSRYPRYIVEWTQEEKRLIELMKKAGNSH